MDGICPSEGDRFLSARGKGFMKKRQIRMDPELKLITKHLSPKQMILLAQELERRARVICASVYFEEHCGRSARPGRRPSSPPDLN